MKPDQNDVERFYTRQRREILQRVAAQRSGRRRTLLAAVAAVLALAAVGLAVQSVHTTGSGPAALEPLLTEAALPLPAFGIWADEVWLEEEEDTALGSMEWLLEGGDLPSGADAYPDFLEPFGRWSDRNEDDTPARST